MRCYIYKVYLYIYSCFTYILMYIYKIQMYIHLPIKVIIMRTGHFFGPLQF